MSEPDYDFWRAERARLLDNNFPTPDTGRCLDAVDTILELEAKLLALRARVAKLEEALKFLLATKWKSVDRDNMEFEGRVTCYQLDQARAALSGAEGGDWRARKGAGSGQ
jgi:hypothetical protein